MLKAITSCGQFTASNGKAFAVHSMIAAYNIQTKDARIYAEFERMGENVVYGNMSEMGARTIIIDSFSSDDWETSSATALRSVIECAREAGFTLIRHGREPRAGVHVEQGASGGTGGEGGYGGAENDEDNDDEESLPRPGPAGSDHDGEKNKRRRMASDGYGKGGIMMDAPSVELFKNFYTDTKRHNDEIRALRENDFNSKHQKAVEEAAAARTMLEEGKVYLQRMRQLMVMLLFYLFRLRDVI
jgi:hypothetical protein